MSSYSKTARLAGALSLTFLMAGCSVISKKEAEPDPTQCWNDKCLTGQMARIVSQIRDEDGGYNIGFQAAAIEMIRRADPEAHKVINAYLENEASPGRMTNLLELYLQSDEQMRAQISQILQNQDTRPDVLQQIDRQAARALDLQCDVNDPQATNAQLTGSLNVSCKAVYPAL